MAEKETHSKEGLRAALLELEKEELVDLILQLSDRLKSAEAKIEKLQEEVEQLRRASKRQAAPFRVSEKKKKKKKKKSGRKKGHKGTYRKCTGPIDDYQDAPLTSCPNCSETTFEQVSSKEQIIEELPAPKVHRTKITTYKGCCTSCGNWVESTHPLQISKATGSAKVQLGPSVLCQAIRLQYDFGLSKRKVCSLFEQLYGLTISPGGLVHLSHRIANKLKGYYHKLLEQVRQAARIHVDETSWYVGRPGYWLWVFANDYLSFYEVADNRSRAVAERVLGKDFSGVLVSDCYAVYDDLCEQQQKCYAHHLKAISQAIEQEPQNGRGFLKLVQKLLKKAIAYHQIRELIPPDNFATICQNLEQKADELIPVVEKPLVSDPSRTVLEFDSACCPFELQGPALAVAKRLAKQRDHLFTFLYFEQVPPTNNLAERQLRPAVISRKMSCGNRTEKGMNTWKILTSILNTLKQKGDSFLQTISNELYLR